MMNFQGIKRWFVTIYEHMTQRERAILVFLGIVLVVSLGLSVAGYVDRHSSLVAEDGGTYTEGIVGQPRYINPMLASTNDVDLDISRVVYSSLFKLDSSLALKNDLAESVETSDDGKTYTIHIRKDALWHDGKPLTADDVLFTIQGIQNSDYSSPLASSFQGVQVNKVDDNTVKFALKNVYAPFLSTLTVGVLPKHVWENIPPRNASLAEQQLKPVGSGPYKFQELTTKKKTGETTAIRLVRNDSFYGARPHIDEITFSFFNSHEEAIKSLTSGKIDGIGFLPSSLAASVEKTASVDLHNILLPQYFGLFFNETKNDILTNAGVRSALALAIDREEIIKDALKGHAENMGFPIPPGLFTFSEIKQPSFDPEKARQNLDEAGWKASDTTSIREKAGKQLKLTITTTDWEEYKKTAEIIQKQWRAVGVDVAIENISTTIIQQNTVIPRNYEILLYGENLSADPDPYPFWHSSQVKSPGLNLSLISDKDIDNLLASARTTSDTAKRTELLHKFVERFIDINPAIILYRPQYLYAQKDKVKGMEMHQGGLPVDRFNDVQNWYVREKRVWNT